MEFEFNCELVTKADKSGFGIVNSSVLDTLPKKSYDYMETLIDLMGAASSKAQNLPTIITSFKAMKLNISNQKMYVYSKKNKCFGFLKTGYKKLFVSTEYGDIKEINPLCVLDFYVSESVQRQGIGKMLFDMMLEDSSVNPEKIAYDRPSEKLLKFLSKHFGLKRYLPQNNNFVVFSQYFNSFSSAKPAKSSLIKSKKSALVDTEGEIGRHDSIPSYPATYSKATKDYYHNSKNVVSRGQISDLIEGCKNLNNKMKRMVVNEECKDGVDFSYDYQDDLDKSSKLLLTF